MQVIEIRVFGKYFIRYDSMEISHANDGLYETIHSILGRSYGNVEMDQNNGGYVRKYNRCYAFE